MNELELVLVLVLIHIGVCLKVFEYGNFIVLQNLEHVGILDLEKLERSHLDGREDKSSLLDIGLLKNPQIQNMKTELFR